MSDYAKYVIGLGDKTSGNFLKSCIKANNSVKNSKFLGKNGQIILNEKIKSITEGIDGVGTKMHIYNNQIELLIQEFLEKENTQNGYEKLIKSVTKIYERILHDIIAMNVDDLRNGEAAIAITNIIDINHLRGIRGKVFTEAMSKAMENVIKETGIMIIAGETAILGETHKFSETIVKYENDIDFILQNIEDKNIKTLLENRKKELIKTKEKLEFNIGGTGLGFSVGNKLKKVKAGQKIIYFSEIPTENVVIGPRANGLTRIRENILQLVGENWENINFEEFLKKIGQEKADKIPQKLKEELSGLKMYDIATGKTTIFNPFISQKLLGGLEGESKFGISGLIHVTGNPLHKISSGIKNDNLMAEIDITNIKIPQIIELLQYVSEIDDEDAMSSWNMGIPYVIICENEDVEEIINLAKNQGLKAKEIGEIKEKDIDDFNKKLLIKGVGINNSTIVKYEELDKDLPKLPKRYKHIHSGKVRETYINPDNENELLIIATDRVSTHDVVHKSLIQGKGKTLTSISKFWFKELKKNPETSNIKTQMVENPIFPKDFPEELKEKTTIVKKLKALPIEAIVRGYLYGSALKGYDANTGKLSTGEFIGKGLQKCSKLEEPIFTPSTKGKNDININFENMYKILEIWLKENGYKDIDARKLAEQVKNTSIKIYKFALQKALEKGDILGDTKFEFALDKEGNLVLIDEILTPDSSRYWDKNTFEEGKEPNSSDKQYVRNEVMNIWEKNPRNDRKKYPVKLNEEVIETTKQIYEKMYKKYL